MVLVAELGVVTAATSAERELGEKEGVRACDEGFGMVHMRPWQVAARIG